MVLLYELNALLLQCGNLLLVLYKPFQFVVYILFTWGYVYHWAQRLLAKDIVALGLGTAYDNLTL